MIVRKATPEDAAALFALDCGRDPDGTGFYTLQKWQDFTARGEIFMATGNGELIGFLHYEAMGTENETNTALINEIFARDFSSPVDVISALLDAALSEIDRGQKLPRQLIFESDPLKKRLCRAFGFVSAGNPLMDDGQTHEELEDLVRFSPAFAGRAPC